MGLCHFGVLLEIKFIPNWCFGISLELALFFTSGNGVTLTLGGVYLRDANSKLHYHKINLCL